MTRTELRNRMDRLIQTCARYEDAVYDDMSGLWFNRCVTCGRTYPLDKIQGGHFIPRGCIPTRWDYVNVNPQCVRCNGFMNGAYIEYSKWMIDHHKGDYYRLVDIYNRHKIGEIKPYNIVEMRELYNNLLRRGRELEEKKNIKLFPKTWKEENVR